FFFQAEDGIRDGHVTGVQTCALPIYDPVVRADIDRLRGRIDVNIGSATDAHHTFAAAARAVSPVEPTRALELAVAAALLSTYGEIGRASCREREEGAVERARVEAKSE